MAVNIEFGDYLASITRHYDKWQTLYTLTDATGKEKLQQDLNRLSGDRTSSPWDSPFDFNLMVQTPSQKKQEPRESEEPEEAEEKVERFSVLEGIRKYAEDHVLLIGRPGSGKSTALAKLALEEARRGDRIPILVELRFLQDSIEGLVGNVLRRHGLQLTEQQLPLLWQSRLLLLMDGLNELPSDQARLQLITFRQIHPQIPMIFTTRDLSVGGDFGIVKKLEMQPLTEEQMRSFVWAYLPSQAEQMLQQLKERLRELGQTPLLLWMLCDLFRKTEQIPENLGMVFRLFTQGYERNLKQDVPIESDREWWKTVLQQLAWAMMQSPDPGNLVEFRVTITWSEAVKAIAQYLEGKVPHAADFARKCLRDLQKYHLIQAGAGSEELEFRHQLLQEYYAAEEFLERLPEMSDRMLQQEYLNYLKWTEPVALTLALVADERQALRVVRSGLNVDAFLGAGLVGKVKPESQGKAVDCLNQFSRDRSLNWNGALKLLGRTGSEAAISHIQIIFQRIRGWNDRYAIEKVVDALEAVGSNRCVDVLLIVLEIEIDIDLLTFNWIGEKVALALGWIGSERAVDALLIALKNHDSSVRRSAAFSLGTVRSERAVDALLVALKDQDDYVRNSIINALMTIGSERAVDALLVALRDREYSIREKAAVALGKIGSERAIDALLIDMKDQEYSVRVNAAAALGWVGSERLVDVSQFNLTYKKHYARQNAAIRETAAAVPKKIDNNRVVDALLIALKDSPSVRREAAHSLGRIGSERAVDALLTTLQDEEFRVRREAAHSLGQIGSERAVDALLIALKDQESCVRKEAAAALGWIGNDQAVDALLIALKDKEFNVGAEAATALGRIGNDRAVDALLIALKVDNYNVSKNAAAALEEIGGEKVIDAFLIDLKDQKSYVRKKAALTLGRIGNDRAVNALLIALQDQEVDVRAQAADALGAFDNDRVMDALLIALKDQRSEVRERTAEALGWIGNDRAIDALLIALKDKDYKVVEIASAKLGKIGSMRTVDALSNVLENDWLGKAADALGQIGSPKPLSLLWQRWAKSSSAQEYSNAIATIQARCKYYNHELEEERKRLAQLNEEKQLTVRTLLILAACPTDQARLRLDREVRDIDESLHRSKHRDRFHIQQKWAVRPDDLRRALLDHLPQILHFCGHGEGDPGIILENEAGKSQLVSTEAITNLFKLFADKGLECVVLNACYAEVQASAIAQHIPYVIGMSAAILDKAALKFSVGFYDALGAGWSYVEAFEMGKSAIATEGIPEAHLPVLKQKLG
jgi:HEAT repeat protein